MKSFKKFGSQTFSSLQLPNFRNYFVGQTISTSGTWMQNIAQGLLILKLTGSGTALGFLIALQFLPLLLFGSFSGLIIDRYSKRWILLVTQTLFAIIAFLHGLFAFYNLQQLWMIYALALCLGIIVAIDNPTKQTFIFEMVGKDKIKNAISLNSVMVNLSRIIGPALAAVLVSTVGLAWCFFLNAFSFIAVLFVLMRIDPKKLHTGKGLTKVKGELTKVFRYIQATPSIRTILILMFILGTFTYEYQVILPLFAEFTFGNPKTGYAILMTAMGVGAVIGGLVSARRKKVSLQSLLLIVVLFGSIMLLTSLAPNIFFAAAGMMVVGFFSINFNTTTNAMLQIVSSPEMRGRVMSIWSIAFLGTTPIGGPIIGWIGEHFGPRWGLATGGLAALLAACLVALIVKHDKQKKILSDNEIFEENELNDRVITLK
jgi:MFS family permease